MPFANVNGQSIHFVDHQAGSGGNEPAIILSHGFSMGHEMWAPQLAPLTDVGWRVITYDERGWGQTTYTEPFTYWDLADDVLALMDHLGLDTAVLGGMSQGGFLTLRAALTSPERVRAMFLVDTEPNDLPEDERVQFQALFDAALAGWLIRPSVPDKTLGDLVERYLGSKWGIALNQEPEEETEAGLIGYWNFC